MYRANLLVGYHGTSKQRAEEILSSNSVHLVPSRNDYDWLGEGIYFWENDSSRAWDWASNLKDPQTDQSKYPDVGVIGAIIDPGYCLDLLTQSGLKKVKEAYELLVDELTATGKPLPTNKIPRSKSPTQEFLYRPLDKLTPCSVKSARHA